MQIQYFSTAWRDVTSSRGWFGKVLLLALVALIPIFGVIVVSGYLFGWARDIAWRVKGPLPESIFGNADGKLYSRGLFVLVVGLVFSLLPWVIEIISGIFGGGMYGWGGHSWAGPGMFPMVLASGLFGALFFVLSIVAWLFAAVFAYVGSMRASVYGRLSAGFQLGKMWSMIRHDPRGVLRIVGMSILMSLVVSVVIGILTFFVVMVAMMVGFAAMGGSLNMHAPTTLSGVVSMIISVGGVALIFSLVVGYISLCVAVFAQMIIVRALGYWTSQFDVPSWRGQDDPMPFELMGQQPGQQQPPYRS